MDGCRKRERHGRAEEGCRAGCGKQGGKCAFKKTPADAVATGGCQPGGQAGRQSDLKQARQAETKNPRHHNHGGNEPGVLELKAPANPGTGQTQPGNHRRKHQKREYYPGRRCQKTQPRLTAGALCQCHQ